MREDLEEIKRKVDLQINQVTFETLTGDQSQSLIKLLSLEIQNYLFKKPVSPLFLVDFEKCLDSLHSDEEKEFYRELNKCLSSKIVLSRLLGNSQINLTVAAFLFLSELTRIPGQLVTYAYYLSKIGSHRFLVSQEIKLISLQDLCQFYIPNGSISQSDLSRIWDLQKYGSSNAFDFPEFWE